MPVQNGIKDDLLKALLTRLKTSMTNLGHSTNRVYYATAPSETQGEERIIYSIPSDIEDLGFSDRNGTGNLVDVEVAAWSPSMTKAALLGDDILESMTATSGHIPTLSVANHTVIDIGRTSRTELLEQTPGLKDEFADVQRFQVRLRKTSTI